MTSCREHADGGVFPTPAHDARRCCVRTAGYVHTANAQQMPMRLTLVCVFLYLFVSLRQHKSGASGTAACAGRGSQGRRRRDRYDAHAVDAPPLCTAALETELAISCMHCSEMPGADRDAARDAPGRRPGPRRRLCHQRRCFHHSSSSWLFVSLTLKYQRLATVSSLLYLWQFLLREGDRGKPKSKLIASRLNELSPFADVRTIPGALTLDLLLDYHASASVVPDKAQSLHHAHSDVLVD